jgi:hypothetical protein
MLHTHQPQTEDVVTAMARRNEARRQIVLRVMGAKYACHPVNQVHRIDAVRSIVSIKLSDRALQRLMADMDMTALGTSAVVRRTLQSIGRMPRTA